MSKIVSKQFNVNLLLHFTEREENGLHFLINELFDLTGYGKTPEEAERMLTFVVNEYFQFACDNDTLEADLSKFKQFWKPIDGNNLPQNEVIAANFTQARYPVHKLIGKLYRSDDGVVQCSNTDVTIFGVTHYFDISQYEITPMMSAESEVELNNYYKLQQIRMSLILLAVDPDPVMASPDPVKEAERIANQSGFTLDDVGLLKPL